MALLGHPPLREVVRTVLEDIETNPDAAFDAVELLRHALDRFWTGTGGQEGGDHRA